MLFGTGSCSGHETLRFHFIELSKIIKIALGEFVFALKTYLLSSAAGEPLRSPGVLELIRYLVQVRLNRAGNVDWVSKS
jgi:hypothetical protein